MSADKGRRRGNAANDKAKRAKVKITTTGDPANPYELKWEKHFLFFSYWGDPPIGSDKDYNLILDIKLHDDARTNVGFATPVTAAFGANAGAGGCPVAGSDAGGEISFANSSGTSTDLSIFDVNKDVGDLQFAVFFDDGTKLDPIIKNTGGGGTPTNT